MNEPPISLLQKVKNLFIGKAINPFDKNIFHNISLIAFFAWVGLGADGISSACYGPEEAFLALKNHHNLAIFVGIASAITIFLISSSYSQIIELFPTGGGGYVVASKLLNPTFGVISGCALIIDYVLTITVSIASGADALFSLFPQSFHIYKFTFAIFGVVFMTILNLRGTKESISVLLPIFLVFLVTHVFAIVYSISTHAYTFPVVISSIGNELHSIPNEIGFFGLFLLLLRAYSMGAGTFTGIEAVSNGLQILREPRVQTGKRTMRYMAISLAVTVVGLMLAYLLFQVEHAPGKTLNAVLFEKMTSSWGGNSGYIFVFTILVSEAAILFVAAQAGFIGGPRVISTMAIDKWFPSQFAMLSDRLVMQNGVILMGVAVFITMIFTAGSVKLLIILYSINVFITFALSLFGVVKHWWKTRNENKNWKRKIFVSGSGFLLSSIILVSVVVLKFEEGGWLTLLITSSLVAIVLLIKKHYIRTANLLKRLDALVVSAADMSQSKFELENEKPKYNPKSKTAVFLVNGFNGIGLHTLLNVIKTFPNMFENFVFVEIGIFDVGNFKGVQEVEFLKRKVQSDLDKYIEFMNRHGYYAEGISSFGTDVVQEINDLLPEILKQHPSSVFFGGQLVFPDSSFFSRWLHNYTIFSLQRRFYQQGVPVIVLPIRV